MTGVLSPRSLDLAAPVQAQLQQLFSRLPKHDGLCTKANVDSSQSHQPLQGADFISIGPPTALQKDFL